MAKFEQSNCGGKSSMKWNLHWNGPQFLNIASVFQGDDTAEPSATNGDTGKDKVGLLLYSLVILCNPW